MHGKVLIWGGIGGIGAVTARALSVMGYDLHLVGRDGVRLAILADEPGCGASQADVEDDTAFVRVGMLWVGLSGYSIVHCDTGGYGALKLAAGGVNIPVIAQFPELFMRWMKLNAFTAIFRTHEGLDPDIATQFDTNDQIMVHLRRFALVYRTLAPYRKQLIAEAATTGVPVVRLLRVRKLRCLHCDSAPLPAWET